MRHYDFREDKMGQVWLIIIPVINVFVLLYWVFSWLREICEDLTDHSGIDFMPHYNKVRVAVIMYIIGLILLPVFGVGTLIILISIIVGIIGLVRIAKDFEEHLIEERSADYWITRGSVALGALFVWPLQAILNAHWRGHGLE